MYLFYDCETSGKADFNLPASHPSQPHLLQIGLLLTDHAGREIAMATMIAKPSGWVITPEAEAKHGISLEMANQFGVTPALALSLYNHFSGVAKHRVAFNNQFDDIILEALAFRLCKPCQHCAAFTDLMKEMTDICRIPNPNPRYRNFKWPKLEEAYRHVFKKDFEGAHSAMGDVRATKDLFFWWLAQQQPPKVECAPGCPGCVHCQ